MTVDISPVGDGLKVNAAAVGFTVNAECQSARLEVRHKVDGIMAEPEPIPVVTYTVTTDLENVTSDAPATVEEGSPLVVTLTGTGDNRVQANSVVVTMGGVDITSSAYDHSTKTVSISSVTGFVSITAVGRPYDAEVEYLQSSGTQYIDLRNKINSDTDAIDVEFVLLQNNSGVFGARDGASSKNFSLQVTFSSSIVVDINNGDYSTYRLDSGTSAVNKRCTVHMEKSNKKISYDGIQIASSTTVSQSFTTTNNAYLFAVNGVTGSPSIRLYPLLWKRSGNTLLDLIPVRKDGIGYLYDKVNKQLFGNSGTSSFSYGNDV